MKRPFHIIGLTGPSGAGKGMVAALFEEYNIPSIDADRVYHDLLLPPSACLDALVDQFGTAILNADGTLNRASLAAIVFEDSDSGRERRQQLNEITHAFVIRECNRQVEEYRLQGKRAVILDAPLLIEAGMHHSCDITLAILAETETRLERLIARDGITRDAALARIRAQQTDDFYRSHADITLYNNEALQPLREAVARICTDLEVIP